MRDDQTSEGGRDAGVTEKSGGKHICLVFGVVVVRQSKGFVFGAFVATFTSVVHRVVR